MSIIVLHIYAIECTFISVLKNYNYKLTVLLVNWNINHSSDPNLRDLYMQISVK